MKKAIIIILIIVALSALYINRIVKSFNKLVFTVDGLKINISNASEIIQGFVNGFSSDLTFWIRNTTGQNFNLDSVYIEIYTPDGSLIARPKNILNKIEIPKNSDTQIKIQYQISVSGLYKMLGSNIKQDVVEMLKSYLNSGYFGKTIRVKGNAKKGAVNVDIDFETEI